MSLKCAVELGIPDIIHKHGIPITLIELDEALCFLTTNTKYTLAPFVFNLLTTAQVKPGHIFSEWYRGTVVTSFKADQGMLFWNYLAQNPAYEKIFGATMATKSHLFMTSIVKEHKEVLENVKSLVDVGCGTGTFARVIADAFPHFKCMVLDLPTFIANIPWTENLEFIGGNMFESIPQADAVLLKGYEESLMVIKSCRKAITTEVIIVDIMVKQGKKQENDEFSKT
ncbi:hypothetical protein MKX01_038573 [Papaver californicum]|nr:hypothetical protein MKX01_038573 [Papaver californicum]